MQLLITCFLFSFLFTSIFAIEPNQWDNFQDGTTQGWGSGASNPNPPQVMMNGGPSGTGDAYLLVTSNGTSGAGSKLITYNTTQWAGDYISAGVNVISMHMNNYGNETLNMRICVQGPGGSFWSAVPVTLLPQSGWQSAQFSLSAAALTGGTDLNLTLSGTTQVRILHSVAGGSAGDIITAELGIDNISAAENPLPVELVSFTARQSGNSVILNWITSSEINNHGFEIERKLYDNENEAVWRLIGFKDGAGTTSEQYNYSFVDDLSNTNAEKIAYRLKQFDFNGSFTFSDIVYVENVVPLNFGLLQNFPNPFNPATVIKFNLPQDEFVSLKVFNSLGKEVANLIDEKRSAGIHQINFEAAELSSGIYYYKLSAGNFSETKKMLLIK
ncbi:MAG: T9SS C-terminal target domain-containing protein [Ignavibacteriales bacterium]|nr:MAG: T9SS C-terminal target domain-containing protein [Ignavibacteriales bacterium]